MSFNQFGGYGGGGGGFGGYSGGGAGYGGGLGGGAGYGGANPYAGVEDMSLADIEGLEQYIRAIQQPVQQYIQPPPQPAPINAEALHAQNMQNFLGIQQQLRAQPEPVATPPPINPEALHAQNIANFLNVQQQLRAQPSPVASPPPMNAHQAYIAQNPYDMATAEHMNALGIPAAEVATPALGPEGQPIVTHIAQPIPEGQLEPWNWEDTGILLLGFVVFAVAFAIVRNLFNRMWGRLPKDTKNNWKKEFKRRLGKDPNKISSENRPDGHNAFNPNENNDHGPYQSLDGDVEAKSPGFVSGGSGGKKSNWADKSKKSITKLFGKTKKSDLDQEL